MAAFKKNESRYGKSKYAIEKFCLKKNMLIIRPGYIFNKKNDKRIKHSKLINFLPFIPVYKCNKNFIFSVKIDDLNMEIFKILTSKNNTYQIFNIFCKKKIFFDEYIKNATSHKKIYFYLNFNIYLLFIRIISKIVYTRSIDSLLSFMTSKKNILTSAKEKNVYTKNSIF